MRIGARRGAAAVIAALIVALVAGCGLPTSSGVIAGRRIDDDVAPAVQSVVPPPPPGASKEVIARNFLRAGANFQQTEGNQDIVGRDYLAPPSVELWRPQSLVTVFDSTTGPIQLQELPGDKVRATVIAVAEVDESGRYVELPPGTIRNVEFQMVRVAGEWRVALPSTGFGIWLTTEDFDRLFQPFRIFYLVLAGRQLVGDVRWFALGPRLATALARAQLGAVPAYLSGAVTTAVPPGTRLAVDAVNVEAGVATVTLTGDASQGDAEQLRGLWAQIVAVLTQGGTNIAQVSISTQNAGVLRVPGLDSEVGSLQQLGYQVDAAPPNARVAVRANGVWQAINPASLSTSQLPSDRPGDQVANAPKLPDVPATVADLAMSVTGAEVAGVSADRRRIQRWVAGDEARPVDLGTNLTRPAYDRAGRLWVGGQDGSGAAAIWALDPASAATGATAATGAGTASGATQVPPPTLVTAPWLADRAVVAVAPSPDGTRLAVVSRRPDGSDTRLDIAGIRRGGTGVPKALADAYQQGEALSAIVALVWVDDYAIAVLGRVGDEKVARPYIADLGQGIGLRRRGSIDPQSVLVQPVPGAVSITAIDGRAGLVVTTSNRAVLVRSGTLWAQRDGVTAVMVGGS